MRSLTAAAPAALFVAMAAAPFTCAQAHDGIGVPFARNHVDPTLAASPLNLTAMFWNRQGGYKVIKDAPSSTGLPVTHDAGRGWALHLGSTGCASEARTVAPAAECANPNHVGMRLDSFDPAADTVTFDVAPVLAQANVDMNRPETGPGCMSLPNDGDCLPVMSRLGLPFRDIAAGAQLFATMR